MPIIQYESQGADKVVGDLKKQVDGLQRLIGKIVQVNGDAEKMKEAFKAYVIEQGKATESGKKFDASIKENSRSLRQAISFVSRYASENDKIRQSQATATQSLKTIQDALQRQRDAMAGSQKATKEQAQELDRLTQAERNAKNALQQLNAEHRNSKMAGTVAVLKQHTSQVDQLRQSYQNLWVEYGKAKKDPTMRPEDLERMRQALRMLLGDIRQNTDEFKRLSDSALRGSQIVRTMAEQARTPWQRFKQDVKDVREAMRQGDITARQYRTTLTGLWGNYRAGVTEGNRGLGAMSQTLLPNIRSQLVSIAGAFGLGTGIAGMIILARMELDKFRRQIEELKDKDQATGEAWRRFAAEIASDDSTGKELGRFKEQIVEHSRKHGYDESIGAYVGAAVLKTAGLTGGKITPESSLETAGFVSEIFRFDRQLAVEVGKGMIDLEKQFKSGEYSKEELYGLLQRVNTESRVDDIAKTSQTFPRLLAYYMSTGMESDKATAAAVADYSMLTQLGVDPTGHISTYALITQASKKQELIRQLKAGEIASEWEEDAHGNLHPVEDSKKINFQGIDISGIKDIDDVTQLLEQHPEFDEVLKQIKVKGGRFSGGMVRLQGAIKQMLTPENVAAKKAIRDRVYNELRTRREDGRRLISNMADAEISFMVNEVSQYKHTIAQTGDLSRDQDAASRRREISMYQNRIKRVDEVAGRHFFDIEKPLARMDSGATLWSEPDMQKVSDHAMGYMATIVRNAIKISPESLRTVVDLQAERIALEEQFKTQTKPFDLKFFSRLAGQAYYRMSDDNFLSDEEKVLLDSLKKLDPEFTRWLKVHESISERKRKKNPNYKKTFSEQLNAYLSATESPEEISPPAEEKKFPALPMQEQFNPEAPDKKIPEQKITVPLPEEESPPPVRARSEINEAKYWQIKRMGVPAGYEAEFEELRKTYETEDRLAEEVNKITRLIQLIIPTIERIQKNEIEIARMRSFYNPALSERPENDIRTLYDV